MKLSAKTDYACRALLELSLHWPNKTPLSITTIAQRQQIPMKFLTQILLNLKQFGYVNSTRGKSGGYLLNLSPRDVKLSDVLKDFEGKARDQNKQINHVMDAIWLDVEATFFEELQKINFEIIRERSRSQEHVMMFGI